MGKTIIAEGIGLLNGAERVGAMREAAESGGAFCDGVAILKMTRELVRRSNSKNGSGGSHPIPEESGGARRRRRKGIR